MTPSIRRGPWSGGFVRRGTAQLLVAFLVLPPPLSIGVPRNAFGAPSGRVLPSRSDRGAEANGDSAERPVAARPGAGASPNCGEGHSCREALASGRDPDVTTARKELWPPNHRTRGRRAARRPGRACRGRATVGVAVYSDEPDDATGDGSSVHDAQLDPPDLYLRSERQGERRRPRLPDRRHRHLRGRDGPRLRRRRRAAQPELPAPQGRREQARRAVQKCGWAASPRASSASSAGALFGPNQPPVVDAGPDQGVDLASSAHLDGSVSDDGLPDGRLDLAWSKVDGPGDVAFTAAGSEDSDASFSESGSYLLRLTATDGELSASDDVRVVVQASNTAPTVDAGPDRSIVLPERSTTLEGAVTRRREAPRRADRRVERRQRAGRGRLRAAGEPVHARELLRRRRLRAAPRPPTTGS